MNEKKDRTMYDIIRFMKEYKYRKMKKQEGYDVAQTKRHMFYEAVKCMGADEFHVWFKEHYDIEEFLEWLYDHDEVSDEESGMADVVYAVKEVGTASYAAVMHADEDSSVTLPGGTRNYGETEIEALKRICKEQGWEINDLDPEPIYTVNKSTIPKKSWYKINQLVFTALNTSETAITPCSATLKKLSKDRTQKKVLQLYIERNKK